MTGAGFPSIGLDLIDVPDDRARSFDPVWVEALAVMIGNQGLFHPISVRRAGGRYQLVSCARRLAAVQLLGQVTIPCRISDADTDDDARLEEVMENLSRQELIALDRCQHLYELKQVWERKYPHTVHGHNSPKTAPAGESQSLALSSDQPEIFGFARANAEKIGLSQSSIKAAVKIWTELSQPSRDRLIGTDLARKQTELKALSEQSPTRQAQVLDMVLGDVDVTNVAGALLALDGGVVPNAEEKHLSALRKQFSALPDPVFDRVILDNRERVLAALRRQGRLG